MSGYIDTAISPSAHRISNSGRRNYLFGPIIDFICMGGSSLTFMPLLLLRPVEEYRATLAIVMLLLANAINHPHFAHSYQIFYRNFHAKCFGADYSRALRVRYMLAGIVVPSLLALFFAVVLFLGSARMLGYAGNLMAFVVGWHFVKQGYGMLMVDAALKRKFFQSLDKRIFVANSYSIWVLSWVLVNYLASEYELWGLQYYAIQLPSIALDASIILAILTTGLAAWRFAVCWKRNGKVLPYNGVVAYVASLYSWLILAQFDPLWFLVIPVLHSLQYLVVVWRFQLNYEHDRKEAKSEFGALLFGMMIKQDHHINMAIFVVLGSILGFLGFWGIPILLDAYVPYDKSMFGESVFLFMFWIFINVHHYFLDNVMWRRENPDTRRYLFG
ncbi:hypothetical protein [Inquilinus sp. OTU3971]|uniref:hypothetical protein n=1 Tax=Inquilinus sp. OTU3971 TaxID=3043855 RepID=UPI00313D7695